jgi:hypothetical protein
VATGVTVISTMPIPLSKIFAVGLMIIERRGKRKTTRS